MLRPAFHRLPFNRHRRGLSFLEFLGCFSAMIGGVLLGSMYLGIDVKATWQAVVQQAQGQPLTALMVEPPAANSPAAEPVVETAEAQPPAEEAEDGAIAEQPSEETQVPSAPEPADATAPTFAEAITLTEEQRKAFTAAYWEALNACMNEELAARSAAISGSGQLQLYQYLSARHDGHRRAAEAIAALNRRGVDAHVLAFGEKALNWHREGAALYARAKDLLTDAPTARLNGPFAQSWQSAATQHEMEERLLAEKRAAVQAYLNHRDEATANITPESPAGEARP